MDAQTFICITNAVLGFLIFCRLFQIFFLWIKGA